MANTHLWLDFETTGLDPRMDTILEAAWTLTDENLTMLTPLRSRLCVINPPRIVREKREFAVGDRSEGAEGHWGRLPSIVRDMHEQTGLRDALESAVNDPVESLRVLTEARDLDRLIREDLASVGYNRFGDRLILSGAGVSHFDDRVLNVHLPHAFPLEGNGSAGYAYWRHDVSIAKRALGPAWDVLAHAASKEFDPMSLMRCDVRPVEFDPGETFVYMQGETAMFAPERLEGHRAADDVVAALIDGRILRDAERLFAAESQRSS